MQDINKALEEAGITKEELVKSLEDAGLRESALLLKNWHELDIHSGEALEKMCSMKKAIKPGPALNYAEMNKPKKITESPAINYAEMNKPQQKPVNEAEAPKLDYAEMNKPKRIEGPSLDYSTMKAPKPQIDNPAQVKTRLQEERRKAGLGPQPPKKGYQVIQERVKATTAQAAKDAKKIKGE